MIAAGTLFVPILTASAVLMGCVSERPITQDDLDKISEKCGLQRSALILEPPTQVKFQPDVEVNYKAVDCALNKIRKIPGLEFGFVGNEVYRTDESGDPIKEGDEGY